MNDHLVRQPPKARRVASSGAELSLGELLRLLWHSRVLVLSITLGLAVAAYGIAWLFPRKYEARVLFEPVAHDSGESALSGALGKFSGLAALAGLTGGTRGSAAVALATLQSRVLTEKFIQQNNLLPILYAKEWNARTHSWKGTSRAAIPTLWRANQFFKKDVRDVSEDRKTGLVTLTITWTDPQLAAQWANGLVAMTNAYMRDKAIAHATAEMAYLRAQASKTSTVEMKNTIYSLMERELQKAMVAAGERQFALRVIDPAAPPQLPSAPRHVLWALAGFIIGLFIASSYVLAHAVRAQE